MYLSEYKCVIFRADFHVPEVSYCDYVWDNLANHAHLPGLVCGLTGRVVLHGEVRFKDVNTFNCSNIFFGR